MRWEGNLVASLRCPTAP